MTEYALLQPVVEIHRSTLSHYQDRTSEIDVCIYLQPRHENYCIDCHIHDGFLHPGKTTDPGLAARCETVLNATMAEFETYHAQKNEDFRRLATEHLDGEIALHEQVISHIYHSHQDIRFMY